MSDRPNQRIASPLINMEFICLHHKNPQTLKPENSNWYTSHHPAEKQTKRTLPNHLSTACKHNYFSQKNTVRRNLKKEIKGRACNLHCRFTSDCIAGYRYSSDLLVLNKYAQTRAHVFPAVNIHIIDAIIHRRPKHSKLIALTHGYTCCPSPTNLTLTLNHPLKLQKPKNRHLKNQHPPA